VTGADLDQARALYERELAALAADHCGQAWSKPIADAAARLLDPQEWRAAGWPRTPSMAKRYQHAADLIHRARLADEPTNRGDEP
jgi:hypothetical protein